MSNRHKFNGINSKEVYIAKGSAVWDPSRREPDELNHSKKNANGVVHAYFHNDEEVLVKWYDRPKEVYQLLNTVDFQSKWTDKYGGGYWLDDDTAPCR
jgi:hypothetical protein